MTIHIDHFNSSCSFDFAFEDGLDDLSLLDWISCKADANVIHHCPVILNIASDSSFVRSYLITPMPDHRCLLTDLEICTSCFFTPYKSIEHIADDILEVIDDEEQAAVTARVIKWLRFSIHSRELIAS